MTLDRILAHEPLSAVTLRDIDLSTAAVGAARTLAVQHTLGRRWRGWMVIDRTANATIWRSADPAPDKTLTLTASADVVISIMVW